MALNRWLLSHRRSGEEPVELSLPELDAEGLGTGRTYRRPARSFLAVDLQSGVADLPRMWFDTHAVLAQAWRRSGRAFDQPAHLLLSTGQDEEALRLTMAVDETWR